MKSRRTARPTALSGLIVVLILAVGLFPVRLPVRGDIDVADSPQHRPIPLLSRETMVAQQFPVGAGAIDSLSLLFGTYQRTNTGTLQMDLRVNRDGGWKTLATQTVEKASLRDNAYYTFSFSPPLAVSAGEHLQVVVQADGVPAQAVALFATPAGVQPAGYQLDVSNAPQPGSILFRASYAPASGRVFGMLGPIWRRSTLLLSVRWQIVLGLTLAVTLVCIVALGRRFPPDDAPPDAHASLDE